MDIDLSFKPEAGLPVREHRRLRSTGRILWSDTLRAWLVWSYEDVRRVLGNTAEFALEGTPVSQTFGEQAMLVVDSPLHHKMRAVWERHVSPSAMEARSETFREIARRLLEPAIAALKAGEMVGMFLDFAAEVVTWLLGMPRECAADLQRWNRLLSDMPLLEPDEDNPQYVQHMRTRNEVYDFLDGEMDRREAMLRAEREPENLMDLMICAEGQNGITRVNATDNLLNFFLGGIDTTSRWLGNIVVVLCREPEILAEIRADRRLLSPAVDEVMRMETVTQLLVRRVRCDGVELAGQTLKSGETVGVLPGAANRDPQVFARPDEFQLHRHGPSNLGFGFECTIALAAASRGPKSSPSSGNCSTCCRRSRSPNATTGPIGPAGVR